jgi:hypothetical protein
VKEEGDGHGEAAKNPSRGGGAHQRVWSATASAPNPAAAVTLQQSPVDKMQRGREGWPWHAREGKGGGEKK